MDKTSFSRQINIFNPFDTRIKITLFGCGSGGSFIALTLAKLGFNFIDVYDFDTVEEVNKALQSSVYFDEGLRRWYGNPDQKDTWVKIRENLMK